MKRLYLARHGETEANRLNIVEGQGIGVNFNPAFLALSKIGGSDLNQTGIKQAQNLSLALAGVDIHMMYTSPALRTIQTANCILFWDEKNPRTLLCKKHKGLLETNFGIFEGMDFEEYKKKYPDLYKIDQEKPSQVAFPEGESRKETYERVCRATGEILTAHCGNDNVLIVSHSSPLSMILIHIFKWDFDKMLYVIKWHNCGLIIIEWKRPGYGPQIICMNNIGHLKKEHQERLMSPLCSFL